MKIKNTAVTRKALELEDILNQQVSGDVSKLTASELKLLAAVNRFLAENIVS